MRKNQIALQLWTVRHEAAADLPGTLRSVHEAGYTAVELAGVADTPASELRRLLDDVGLRPAGEHVGLDRLRADETGIVQRLNALGCERVIVPWLAEEERRDPDGVRAIASELNALGRRLAATGLRLGYHNHALEFDPLAGTTAWDVLAEELASDIELEIDVFWAAVGGRDPVALIRELGSRVRLLHLKDRAPGPEPRDAPAGEGTLDMAAIVEEGRNVGVEWYIAEQDEPADALVDIQTAYRNLAALTG